jgi:hypothetical protein
MELMKSYKWLVIWSVTLLLVAFIVKFIPLSKPLTQWVGGIELILAVATGVAFGIKTVKKVD